MQRTGAALCRGAARTRTLDRLSVGSSVEGFVVRDVAPLKEFDMTAIHLEHEKTGAKYVHMDCDDTNNAFSVVFRTPVENSTGLPHILEHTVLCGSERFPVRDPFFNMTKRSLNTYMNALTASDHTMYPFATRNAQDFENLMKVYLDAVFFPKLEENDFRQEGHRLELDPADPNAIVRTGIVYNEMKGTLGNASTLFHYNVQKALLPGTQFEHISGGDPPAIANLTHQALKDFHRKHYHPSNALLYSYGDLPLENHLQVANSFCLDRFQFSSDSAEVYQKIANSEVDRLKRSETSSPLRFKGPPEPMLEQDKQAVFGLVRLLREKAQEPVSEYERLVSRVVSTLLFEGPNAPLYQGLIESQVAPDYSPGSGYDANSLHHSFQIGVQGIRSDDESIETVKASILEALKKVVREGFDERRTAAVLHQVELSLKNRRTNFGLMVMHAVGESFAHATDPSHEHLISSLSEGLSINNKIDRLIQETKEDPEFWQKQVASLFLEKSADSEYSFRQDLLQVLMEPEENFVGNLAEIEKKELQQLSKQLTPNDLKVIGEQADQLREAQAIPQDVNCLPTLSISDVPRVPEERVEVDDLSGDNSLLWVKDQQTNGVVYVRSMFDISFVPDELFPLLHVFCTLLGNVDTARHSYQELAIESDLVCDGLSFSPVLVPWYGGVDSPLMPKAHKIFSPNDAGQGSCSMPYRQTIAVSSTALAKNLDSTIDLLGEVLTSSNFVSNRGHTESILATLINSSASNVTGGALSYARKWSLANLGNEHLKREATAGLSQVSLLQDCPGALDDILPLFDTLLRRVFHKDNMTMRIVAGGSEIDQATVVRSVERLGSRLNQSNDGCRSFTWPENLSNLPGGQLLRNLSSRRGNDRPTYIPLPISVHNATASIATDVSYGHPDDAAMMVLGQIMSTNYLHKEIREKGGAYGGGSSHDMSGLFHMYSYYDPRTVETLDAFEDAIEWARKGSFDDRDVDEALLSMFGSIDAPQELGSKGAGGFLYGLTHEQRQRMRDRFFDLNKDRLVDAANKHFAHVEPKSLRRGCVAIAGNEETDMGKDWDVKKLKVQ